MTLGDLLRSARTARGLTLREAASRAGVGYTDLHRYETGKHEPKIGAAVRLVRLYRLPWASIVAAVG